MIALVRMAIKHAPAMNLIMIGVMLVGAWSLTVIRREAFPSFTLDMIQVSVVYPGATPQEIEEGICLKIEEAVRSIVGVKKVTSTASEGLATISLELKASVTNADRIVNEVRSQVDQISSFPDDAEEPEIRQMTMRETSIKVGIVGPDALTDASRTQLRDLAEEVREDLLSIPSVAEVELLAFPEYQIDVEISEEVLRAHQLSIRDVANTIRRENHEMPGGTIRSDSQEVLVRGDNRRTDGLGIGELPVLTQTNGNVLTVADLANVRDGFADTSGMSYIQRKPGIALAVQRNQQGDILKLVEGIDQYIASKQLPIGFSLVTWADRSVEVKDRFDLLVKNGVQGLCLVFLVLALFLHLRLAFWVALGIPFAVFAAGGFLYFTDQTLNMISMFAFVMALGIVVDDAIVVGENVYVHREMGKPWHQAAMDATVEVTPSVVASVTTTIFAFTPLLFVSGQMGKFIAVMPVGVIAMLVASLCESVTILPSHLSHPDSLLFRFLSVVLYAVKWVLVPFEWLRKLATASLDFVINSLYLPALRWSLRNRSIVTAGSVASLIASFGLVQSQVVPFVMMPQLDSNSVVANIVFPDGTPEKVTQEAVKKIENAFYRVADRYAPQEIIKLSHRVIGEELSTGGFGAGGANRGSHVGSVEFELTDTQLRNISSSQLVDDWRDEAGGINGVERLQFSVAAGGPAGVPIQFTFKAKSRDSESLEQVVSEAKAVLATYPGVIDIRDNANEGKWEYQVRVKDDALSLGVQAADISETLRATYYGEEVMRLQRGRHEVRLMVRYPPEERGDLGKFEEIRVRTGDGLERPITELAEVNIDRGYSTIHRRDQSRTITVSANVIEDVANSFEVTSDLKRKHIPRLLETTPNVDVIWEGQAEQTAESFTSLAIGFGIAFLAMFILLSFEFNSYVQPGLILMIIPFGTIGAIVGHYFMGLPITLFSVFGMVALTGVVINDSIVLIDFINARVNDSGVSPHEGIIEAGQRRFRPVVLTSITTVAGLLPILSETSTQAQLLIPMATSLAFGLMLATFLILFLVPVFASMLFSSSAHEDPIVNPLV